MPGGLTEVYRAPKNSAWDTDFEEWVNAVKTQERARVRCTEEREDELAG